MGKKGSLRVRGGLPFAWAPPHAADSATEGSEEDPAGGGAMPGIHVDASEIEVKVRNVYSGEARAQVVLLGTHRPLPPQRSAPLCPY